MKGSCLCHQDSQEKQLLISVVLFEYVLRQAHTLKLCSCAMQGEKLSSTLLFAALQLAAGLLLGIHLPSDIAQLVIFLPNSR